MNRHLLSVLAYVVASFATQALSHFVVNAGHYATIPYLRAEPVFAFGIGAMLIQGGALSVLYSRTTERRGIGGALRFAWLVGLVLVSYIALGEAGKYAVPSSARWIGVEAIAGFAQFTAYGLLLGVVHGALARRGVAAAAAPAGG